MHEHDYEPRRKVNKPDAKIHNQLLGKILLSASKEAEEVDVFSIMNKRRSTRNFDERPIEDTKIEDIISAADTAPTAGNFQGFEIYYIKNPEVKKRLVSACNGQPYVNAPLVLVFCKNPQRVKFNFSKYVLKKFAIQDATLAASYAQLASHALGLSSIWIGMFKEKEVMEVIGTDLIPSSILCVGYPSEHKQAKIRRNIRKLVHVIE